MFQATITNFDPSSNKKREITLSMTIIEHSITKAIYFNGVMPTHKFA